MRRLPAVLLAGLLILAGGAEAYVRVYRASVVRCGSSPAGLFPAGPKRVQVRVTNLGNATIWIGQTGQTLTTANGWPLHAGAIAGNIVLRDTAAGMDCVTADTNAVDVGILEELE